MKYCLTVVIFIALAFPLYAADLPSVSIENQVAANLNQPLSVNFSQMSINNYQSGIYNEQPDAIDDNGKSVIKAGLYSFMLPGWGQYYNNKMTKARIFFAAEILTWVSYFSLRTYGSWRNDDMVRFANSQAGADIEDKDEIFTGQMDLYWDIDQYNGIGRILEPGSPYYSPNSSYYWRWQSAEDKDTFGYLRERGKEAYRASKWMFIVGLINRVVSTVDAVRDAKRGGNAESEDFLSSITDSKFALDIDPMSIDRQIKLTYYPGF